MKLKNIIIIIGIIAIIIIGCLVFTSQSNQINIGSTHFKVPDGYNIKENNDTINLTNNKDSIILMKHTKKNLNKTVEEYMNSKNNTNNSVQLSKINIDNITVYKVTVNNSTTTHYWFEKNNNVYEFYTWSTTPNTDIIVNELIKSSNSII